MGDPSPILKDFVGFCLAVEGYLKTNETGVKCLDFVMFVWLCKGMYFLISEDNHLYNNWTCYMNHLT